MPLPAPRARKLTPPRTILALVSLAAFVSASLLVLVASFLACGGAEFTLVSQDGGAGDASSVIPPVDSGAPTSDSSAPGAGGDAAAIVYASVSNGADTNDGLSPAAPKKTLVAALAAAVALDAGAEVHACAGTYTETGLVLNAAVSLRGAYDCSTWSRTTTFGYPTFDRVNVTLIQNGNPASQTQTLVVSGAVPATSTVDGFTIEGAFALEGTTTGVQTRDSASPLFTDDAIAGGAGQTTSADGSIGVDILGASSPTIRSCLINGGTGTGLTGSVGVVINSTGTPYIHGNTISGGLGTTTGSIASIATWGIVVDSSAVAPNALEDNTVVACDSPGVIAGAGGIHIGAVDASVDVTGSQIIGCVGAGDGGSGYGIQANAPGSTLRILGDRVWGGARAGASAYTTGVSVIAAASLTIHDSMIHGGDAPGASSASNGIFVAAVAGASIVDDTVYGGAGEGTGIVLAAGESGARITDVILLGEGPGDTHVAVFANNCSGALASLDHTLFANVSSALYSCDLADGGFGASATTIPQLEAILPTEAVSDLVYGSMCASGAGCVATMACPAAPAVCFGALFGAPWGASTDGIAQLFSSTAPDGGTIEGGWVFASAPACAIAEGGIPVSGITTDLYGTPRNPTTPTIGAAEFTGMCTP